MTPYIPYLTYTLPSLNLNHHPHLPKKPCTAWCLWLRGKWFGKDLTNLGRWVRGTTQILTNYSAASGVSLLGINRRLPLKSKTRSKVMYGGVWSAYVIKHINQLAKTLT